jgi:hypothetical protein
MLSGMWRRCQGNDPLEMHLSTTQWLMIRKPCWRDPAGGRVCLAVLFQAVAVHDELGLKAATRASGRVMLALSTSVFNVSITDLLLALGYSMTAAS